MNDLSLHQILQNHAVELLGTWLERAFHDGWVRFDSNDGLRIWPNEVRALFARRNLAMIDAQDFEPRQVPVRLHPARLGAALRAGLEAALPNDPAAELWLDVAGRLHLTATELQLLALLVALHADQAILRAYRYGWANLKQDRLTWGFAVKLLSSPDKSAEVARRLDPRAAPLLASGLVTCEDNGGPMAEWPLLLHADAARVLLGWSDAPALLTPWADVPEPADRLRGLMKERLRRVVANRERCRAAIFGPEGSGRLSVAGQIASGIGVRAGLIQIDLGRAAAQHHGRETIAHARTMAVLLDTALVIQRTERLDTEQRAWIEAVEDTLTTCTQPVIWIFDADPPEQLRVPPEAIIGLGFPTRQERQDTWEGLVGPKLRPTALYQLAGQFLLAEGQIRAVVDRVLAQNPRLEGDPLCDHLTRTARAASQVGLGRLATPEPGRVTFEQLVIDTECEDGLRELISYSRNRHVLGEEWGFARNMPYGLGVTALFAGPPGTGKTFAAQVIATALGLELYRVDLSQLVSKYIGETEKHLSQLFAAAEQGEVMLLFDEADSVFAKRTEVKSSVDRYANLEVNYLLQRIERFSGVVILTTNFEAGLDDAFARRIRFRIPFDEPDEESRKRLWQVLFPKEVPLGSDVDFDELAELYELSGGHIKEIILRASAIALDQAARDEQIVTQALLMRSADVEYKKLGRLPVQL